MNDKSNKIVSVIIVTCGANNYIKPCLASLKAQTHPFLEIILVDNSSGDKISDEIKRLYPDIKSYSNHKNLFYCHALNKGIEMSNGDFILCLNDDVVLDKRFIEKALAGFFVKDKIGMVSGKILRSGGKILDSTGLFLSFWRTAKERGYGTKDVGQFEKEGFIFGVNGAVAFYRREMLENIKEGANYFDSDFRMFYEDLDISWRAQRFGWRAYYLPQAIAYHVRGGSFRPPQGIGKPFARRYLDDELQNDLIKNRYLTIIKNESTLSFLLRLPALLLYDLIQWVYILFFKPKIFKIFIFNIYYIKSAFLKRKLYRSPSTKAKY